MKNKINLIGISGFIGSGKDTVAQMIQWLTIPNRQGTVAKFDTTTALFINDVSTWRIKKFAAILKQTVALITGIHVVDIEKEEVKSSYLSAEWDYWQIKNTFEGQDVGKPMGRYESEQVAIEAEKRFRQSYQWEASLKSEVIRTKMTVRDLLQRLGTDAMRNQVHPNIHVNATFAKYKSKIEGRPTPKLSGGIGGGGVVGVPVYPKWLISDVRFPNEAESIKQRGGIILRINRPSNVMVDTDILSAAGKAGYEQWTQRHPSETSLDNWQFDYTISNNGDLQVLLQHVESFLKYFEII